MSDIDVRPHREQVDNAPALDVVTAIPLNVRGGSGCYVGTRTLLGALDTLGVRSRFITPTLTTPVFALTRVIFNESLRRRVFDGDVIVGIDADGYAIAGRKSRPHVACIKGVLADVLPFETGATLRSMRFQAKLEATHARRADLVITVSSYCARRLADLYGVWNAVVVPELIDLSLWRSLFSRTPARRRTADFSVLTVCRFYSRKRVDVLLRAAALLRGAIPGLAVRIVGNGPEYHRLAALRDGLGVADIVHFTGDLSLESLASEYRSADIFCLPSAQEGFGIVLLEAMAAGKPIVATKAAAIPEVARHGILVEAGDPEALAGGILRLYSDSSLRAEISASGLQDVEAFDSHRVAAMFVTELARVSPAFGHVLEKIADREVSET